MKRRAALAVCIFLAVVICDQLVKMEVKLGFTLHESVRITDWFQLVFTENRGMAFGMAFVGTMFLALFRVVAICFFCYALSKLIRRLAPYGLVACISLIIAGALGNIIDNCLYGLIYTESTYFEPARLVPFGQGYGSFLSGRVVDMFYFPLFTWPDWMPLVGGNVFFGAIFNVADAAISCGAVALVVFYYRYLSRSKFFSPSK